MRILLVGQQGQVAYELERALSCLGEVITRSRTTDPGLDLSKPKTLRATVDTLAPDLIVNAAAYTQVDRAESEIEATYAINTESVGELALACRDHEIPLIHYSTDYVFDGRGTVPYREMDATGPIGVYATSKALGEEKIRETGIPHLILRTAWVYGLRGQNFLNTMLRLMAERESLGIVDDQIGAPTWSRQIAEATTLMLAQQLRDHRIVLSDKAGTYHLSAGGTTTWFGFAKSIREKGMAQGYFDGSVAELRAITTKDYPTPAQRPAYSVLDNARLFENFGIQLPHWDHSLSLCLEDGRPR
jgi:dTDP-4-dehydrorhamnose reductase